MARRTHLTGRFGTPRRWRRVTVLTALLAAIALAGAFLYMTRPKRLARLASDLLTGMTGAQVHIDDARLGADGTIRLRHVVLTVPQMPEGGNRLFEADDVLIRHDLWSLVRGKFHAKSLTLSLPTLYLTEDLATGTFNYQLLQRSDGSPAPLPTQLPEVFVRQGRVVRSEIDRQWTPPRSPNNPIPQPSNIVLGTIRIDGKLTEDDEQPGNYHFLLRQLTDDANTQGPRLAGRINLRDMTITKLELENFTFDRQKSIVLPRRLRDWWEQMDPGGSLSQFELSYDGQDAIGLQAVMKVEDIALTLPYLDQRARMTDTSGRFIVTVGGTGDVRDTITIENLRGKLEGIQYTINGRINGFGLDAPFDLTLQTDSFEIPEQPPFLPALPEVIRKQFHRFKPTGTFEVEVKLKRTADDEHLQYTGSVSLSGVSFTYEKFAYPLHELTGVVRFNDKKIWIDPEHPLQGRGPGDARLTINAKVAPPGDAPAVHMTIDARNIRFDRTLINALPEKYRSIVDICGNPEQLQRLVDMGLVDPTTDGSGRGDPFNIGGTTDMFVTVERGYGPGQEFRISVDLEMTGLGLLFKFCPYPIRVTGGKALIDTTGVSIQDVTGTGPHGGSAAARGTLAIRKRPDGKLEIEPDVTFQATGIPIDPLLLASIPQPQDQWVRDLNLTGTIDAEGRLFNNEHGKIDFSANLHLVDGTATPFNKRFVIDDLTGSATIKADRVEIHQFKGKRGDSVTTLSGWVRRDDGQWYFRMDFDGRNLRFEDHLLDLIPPDRPVAEQLVRLVETHKPTGTLNAHLIYSGGGDQNDHYQLELEPTDLAFTLRNYRITLTQTGGKLLVEPETITLDNWAVSFGTGSIQATGVIRLGAQPDVDVTFNAQSSRFGDATRAVLPDAVLKTIDGLSFDGAYRIEAARLSYTPGSPDDDSSGSAIDFRGTVHLTDGSAEVGVPITEMDSTLAIEAIKQPQDAWPRLDLRIEARQLRAAGRLITPLTIHIASTEQLNQLKIERFQGLVYGGLLLGKGQIQLGSPNQYSFHLTVHNAPLDPILHPEKRDADRLAFAAAADPYFNLDPENLAKLSALNTGQLSASLQIQAITDDPTSRRGRGELEIKDARLYELPLAMAVLQILNFTLPTSGAFDRASARFLIDGDTVLFDDVRIEAPTVEISGSGQMRYSDHALDLVMFSSNPDAINLGPISDMLSVFKDELIRIRVGGTLDDPDPRIESFGGIRRTWDRIFGRSKKQTDQKPLRGTPSKSAQ